MRPAVKISFVMIMVLLLSVFELTAGTTAVKKPDSVKKGTPAVKETPVKKEVQATKEAENPDDDPDADDKMDLLYLPTPEYIVDKMLELAEIKKGDMVYDLGCGDGRVVVRAAKKYGVKGVGIDLNPERVQESMENVKEHKVEKLVTIKQGNVLKEDVRKATVVLLYILPDLMAKLEPILLSQLKPGSRVVSHAFMMDDWPIEKQETYEYEGQNYNLYLYVVPPKTPEKQSKK